MKHFLQIGLIKTYLFFLFCLANLTSFAQAPAIQWEKTIGGNGEDRLSKVLQTHDGGFLIAGYSDSDIFGDKTSLPVGSPGLGPWNGDYWIVKLDANGNKVWDKTIGGFSMDFLTALISTKDKGFLLGGYSGSNISGDKSENTRGNFDYWIVKLDLNGNKQWDKTFGGSENEYLNSFAQTSDGGYILGGRSDSGISGDKTGNNRSNIPFSSTEDYWIVKVDSLGNKQWDKTYGGDKEDRFYSLKETPDKGFILGGWSNSTISGEKSQANKGGTNDTDFWVIKTDSLGNKIWDRTFGTNSPIEELLTLTVTNDGNYLLGGFTNAGISGDKTEPSKGLGDYWIIKIDNLGYKIWDKSFGGSGGEGLINIQQTNDNGFILGGNSSSGTSGERTEPLKGSSDYWIVKIDQNGTKIWDKALGGSGHNNFKYHHQTADAGYIVGGISSSGISGDKTEANKGADDYWIVKLGPDQINSTKELPNTSQLSIYPNPTTTSFTLQLSTNQSTTATLTNSLGQQIQTRNLIPENGNITSTFSTKHLAKGIYNLSITTNQTRTVKKIVVQ